MKKNVLILIGIIISLNISAQKLNYSIGLQVNRSQIGSLSHLPQSPDFNGATGYYVIQQGYNIEEKYNNNIGFKVLGNIDYALSNKLSIRSGIRINLLRFHQKTEVTNDNSSFSISPIANDGSVVLFADYGNPFGLLRDANGNLINVDGSLYAQPVFAEIDGNFSDIGRTTILYTEIPISVLYNYHRFNFEVGASASIKSFSKRVILESNELYGFYTKNSYNDSGLTKIIWLVNIGVNYNLVNGLELTMNYSRGLNGIYTSSLGNAGIPKYNIFSLGLNYKLK